MLRFNLQFMAGPPNRLASTVIASLSLLLPSAPSILCVVNLVDALGQRLRKHVCRLWRARPTSADLGPKKRGLKRSAHFKTASQVTAPTTPRTMLSGR